MTTTARHTPGPWRIGKTGGSIVSDSPAHDPVPGSDEVEYYGGYLIAESVSVSNLPIIAAATEMYEGLEAAFLLAECGEVPAQITVDRWAATLAKADGKAAQ